MIKKMAYVLMILSFVVVGVYGYNVKKNTVDLSDYNELLNNNEFYVNFAYMPELGDTSVLDSISSSLKNSEVILKIEVGSNSHLIFQGVQYYGRVVEVFAGPSELRGNDISIIGVNPLIHLDEHLLVGYFTNHMRENQEYLVFLDNLPAEYGKGSTFTLNMNMISYLSYNEMESIDSKELGEPYSLVRNNEFFANAEGHKQLLKWKSELMATYDKNYKIMD